MNSAFTFVDLFAGIGGFRLALESLGGRCLGFSEIEKNAIETYCANFQENEKKNFGDITRVPCLPEHDFMTAGVPCQSWSIAGKNLGFDDDRGQLWNDAIFLLRKSRPKAFLFENVKGLADPRNKEALQYILDRIAAAGYYAKKYVINAYDYGVPQTRIRIYIVGFKDRTYFDRFRLPPAHPGSKQLSDVLDGAEKVRHSVAKKVACQSLSCNEQGFNDYFLFNDLRDGETTIHSWDMLDTSQQEKRICMFLLKNRRKRRYGPLDGNPLSLGHFKEFDASITQSDLDGLADKGILKKIPYLYKVMPYQGQISEREKCVLSLGDKEGLIGIGSIKNMRELKKKKIDAASLLEHLSDRGIVQCAEIRYDFRNARISTGLNGVNRIFLPSSKIYPTLVASDTNDFVSAISIKANNIRDFRAEFMRKIFIPHEFRRISKAEACRIQGFPDNFLLPAPRAKWMRLLGNSVAVPVVKMLAQSIADTGVFSGTWEQPLPQPYQELCLFDNENLKRPAAAAMQQS